ncbi:MAG: hypothetical protein JWM58_4510 [Rhizobium sp.]|nr:hypothetical protein [Rhizobium sp.]
MAISDTPLMMDAPIESSSSAVSWGPIFAGALVAAAISLLLLLVGAGLGFAMVSPWSSQSASAATIGATAAVWLVVVQWLSSGLGGYLTGRLRTKWVGVHTDEVGFRDTAHGFLAWAVATLLVAGVLSSSVSSIIGMGAQATATIAGATTTAAASVAAKSGEDFSTSYFTDALLRPSDPASATNPATNTEASAAQLSRILTNAAIQGKMSAADRTYVDKVVAARTGLPEADAKARVDAVLKEIEDAKVAAQQAADEARKAASATSLLGALSLFIGAFIASVAAAFGGRQRDDDEEVLLRT